MLGLLLSATIVAGLVGTPAATAARHPDLVQVAASDKQFSTLVRLVRAAGLVRALSSSAKLTVLAPTNAAFSKVPKRTLDALARDRRALRRVLLYHVLRGAVPARTIVTLRTAPTLAGPDVKIRVRGRSVFVNDAKVVKTDVKASNGIIHVINRVLIPPR
ncbi:fasciclin domain-containing protein [Conexibacter sp. JD483]|uniref:fasciclin domain-containing protein n=1 Tax=unclassified Conexibacter TaxID=2627773 RepID=UPI0027222114|nr:MULTISPECIES: fasciclin domain-containing protein [unclassified Conexibacter]MDO8188507.1 fasciclin domain-containing protein [Conexibacter sp. CPCC 205706]MDO8200149.1 fasciclin domain-containing protein [Conexibacter sp. CPCC 205762]MDR9371188.1 fasciclin domain-containing protein [Conexibacter sp. JD483]